MRPLQWWAESAPPGEDRVKVSENLGATTAAPVAPVDTSLLYMVSIQKIIYGKRLQFQAILLHHKKCDTEKRTYVIKGSNLLNLSVLFSIPFNRLPCLEQF